MERKKDTKVHLTAAVFCSVAFSVPPGEDHHPGGGGGPRAGGRRGLDPAAWHRQDHPQEPSTDAHQRQSNVQIKYELSAVLYSQKGFTL